MTEFTIIPKNNQRDFQDRLFAGIAIATIILAWFIGGILNQEDPPNCRTVLPNAINCQPIGNNVLEGTAPNEDGSETIIGWASVSSESGYAGPITVLTGVNPAGEIIGVQVLEHTETPGYFDLVVREKFVEEYVGRVSNSPFTLGEDVDSVTRATFTANAINEAVREASYTIAETQVGLTVDRPEEPIVFGVPEITIILLYMVGWVGHRGGFKYKRIARWTSLLVGMIVLGFMFNLPLTLAHFNSLFSGFLPAWRSNLYWYLLVGGILFITAADGKNPYCSWFCPFGAAQECLGAVGGAKLLHPGQYRHFFSWLKRGLAWSAIVVALLLRNPGVSSYEIFGALFSFNAVSLQWIVLIIILLMSLFIRRPWCNFLCPIDPVEEFVTAQRRWIRKVYRQWRNGKEPSRV